MEGIWTGTNSGTLKGWPYEPFNLWILKAGTLSRVLTGKRMERLSYVRRYNVLSIRTLVKSSSAKPATSTRM
jgi:hypothetical protein